MLVTLSEFAPAILVSTTLLCILWIFSPHILPPLRGFPYPPGPAATGLLSGNKSDISVPNVWRKYNEWAKEYGNLLHLRIFGQHIIVLNSLEASIDLLERRSKIYSSRPVLAMYDMMGFTGGTAMRTYGTEWRKHRRIFQEAFKPDSALAYRPAQANKARDMLYGILHKPDEFERIIYTYAGAIILSVVYGIKVKPQDDPYINLAESTRDAFGVAQLPTWLVNSFPFLRHIPLWFPGAGFKRYADSIKCVVQEQRTTPFSFARTSPLALEETHIPVVPKLLGGCSSEYDLQMLREAAGSGYGAGVGTTASTIMVFLVAMLTYPEIQKKAQAEIDRITQGERLPNYDDQSSLPYIQAVIQEVIRWKPLAPAGLPHANNEDDIYNGYHIPKGSIIYANIWAMTRDPKKYKDPEEFIPERFLTETGQLNGENVTYAFGFGRRICPGRHLGIASAWIAVATILACFNIENKKDQAGKDLPFKVSYTDKGLTSAPYGLQCSMTVRSEKARSIVMDCYRDV